MKLHGKKVEGVNTEIVVIPRTDADDIVFKAGPIFDFQKFDTLCPEPKPPAKVVKGQGMVYNLKDKGYQAAIESYNQMRMDWIVLESLTHTEWLEWETVDMGNRRTWANYKKELKDAGFSHFETQRIVNAVFLANGLNEARVQEARDAFLRGPEETPESTSGQSTDQDSTSSGEPAKDGA